MPYLPRTASSRTVFARTLFTSVAVAAAATSAMAQTTPNAVSGRDLYADTPNESGNTQLTSSCNNCHDVQSRRARIAGNGTPVAGQAPAITYDQAMTRLSYALNNVPSMSQFRTGLSGQQIQDIGAYLADTPKVNVTTLSFTATAVNTMSAAQTVTITAPTSEATAVTLRSTTAIAGTGAGKFSRTYNCDNVAIAPGASCSFQVTFSPQDTTFANPVLNITLNQGASSTAISRRVLLEGTVSASPAPAPAPAPSPSPSPAPAPAPAAAGDSGGGAIGWEWLAALAAAAAALGARRRDA